MSVRNSFEGHFKLLDTTKCKVILIANDFPAIKPVATLLAEQRDLQAFPFYPLEHWIGQDKASNYPFVATLDEDGDRAFAILHTSGSTALPEPIVYTFGAVATYQTWLEPEKILPGAPRNTVDRWKNKVHYSAFPISHVRVTLPAYIQVLTSY